MSAVTNIQQQQKFWNKVAYTKESTTPFALELFQKFVPNLNAPILEIGCGYGRILNMLHTVGYKNLTGTDIAQAMLARGKQEFPYLNLIQTTTPTKIFAAHSFAAIILSGVLTCIVDNNLQAALINDIRELLTSDGVVYVTDFLLNTDQRNCERYNKLQLQRQNCIYGTFEVEKEVLLKHHTVEWIQTLLAPFAQLHYQTHTFKTLNHHSGNGFVFIGKNA